MKAEHSTPLNLQQPWQRICIRQLEGWKVTKHSSSCLSSSSLRPLHVIAHVPGLQHCSTAECNGDQSDWQL